MPRLNPIWLAIPSFGALICVARADPQSCPSQVIPSLLPHTSATSSKQRPRTEKSVATGGKVNVQADNSEYDVTSDTAIFTGNVVIRQGERLLKADREPIEFSRRGIDLGGDFRYLEPGSHGELSWNYLPYDMEFEASCR
jgi:lipopolysaccharide assembly outer membrane protein LptD (OstA)